MLDLSRDIHSLTDFKRKTADYMRQIKETKSPVVLTVNGKAELVVQDAESFQALIGAVERAETIAGVRRGLDDLKSGRARPLEDVEADMRLKYNI